MKLRFWGTRGSISKAGASTLKYGGSTSCVEIRSSRGTLIILDCGTGALALGDALQKKGGPITGYIFISHTHWDHIQGLPFFTPLFVPGNTFHIFGPKGLDKCLKQTLEGQMQYSYFPVTADAFGAVVKYHDIVEESFMVEDVRISTHYLNHPALTLAYRVECDGASVVYCTDHEMYDRSLAGGSYPAPGSADDLHCSFFRGCSLLIHDSQYTKEEYQEKVGWGHSTWEYVIHMAAWAQVGIVALFHHDPRRSDEQVDAILAAARNKMRELTEDTAGMQTKVIAAQEQWSLEVQPTPVTCARVFPHPSAPSMDLDRVPSLPTPPLSLLPPTLSAAVVGCACSGGNPDAPLPSLPCLVENTSLPCVVADASLPCVAAHGGVDPAPDDQNDTNASCALIDALAGEDDSAAPSVTDKWNAKAALGDKVEAPVVADARFPAVADAEEPVFELVMFVTDAHVLSLLRQALAEEPRIVICHAASEGELMEMVETLRPSLVLLGKNLLGVEGGGLGLHLRVLDRLGPEHPGLIPMLVCEDGQRPPLKDTSGLAIREFLDQPFSPAYARTRILCNLMRRQCRWVAAPFPPNEEARLAATHALSLLDTERELKWVAALRLWNRRGEGDEVGGSMLIAVVAAAMCGCCCGRYLLVLLQPLCVGVVAADV
eukprot:jgi/Mesvir1/15597/Mv03207-RA.3